MEGLAPAEAQSSNSSSSDLAIDVSKTMESEKSLQEPERVVTSEDQISPVDIDLEKQSTHHDPEEHQSAARVMTAQDWTSPNDPENPFNWSINKKSYHILVAGLFALSVTFGSSVYTASIHEVSEHFHVSQEAALLPLSLWTLGLAFGPMISAPISETLGRLIVYRLTVPISLLFTLGAGFSQNFGSLLVLRFLGGAAGSAALAVGAGTSADMFPLRLFAYSSSCFVAQAFLGPALGPIVGGFAAQYKGWRWTQWCILFLGTFSLIVSVGMKETYKKVILQKRAKRLGIAPPKAVGPSGLAKVKFLLIATLFRPLHMLIREPIVGLFSLYSAYTFGIVFAFFAAFPYTFTKVYGFDTSQNGLVFVAVGVGIILGWATIMLVDGWLYQKEVRKVAAQGKPHVAPEHRLYAAMIGSVGISVGIFWFAWTAREGVHWISPILATVPMSWGIMTVFLSTTIYIIDVYGPLNGASAMAANGLARYGAGAVFPLFTIQMYNRLGIAWATSLLGFLSLLLLPIPFLFFKFGSQIRSKSAYDTIKA